jgi:ribonuclease P protein subunit RPR2
MSIRKPKYREVDYLLNLAIEKYFERSELYKRYAYIAWRIMLHSNLELRKYSSLICRKCGSLLIGSNSKVRVKNKFINIECINCGYIRKVYVKSSRD